MDIDKFDRDFRRTERMATLAFVFGVVWLLFLMCCLGTALFLLGRWTGVW